MGLPGSGKTTLAEALHHALNTIGRSADWYNADIIRKQYDDWDFSLEGRLRQAQRMQQLANDSSAEFVVCDFVAPLPEQRKLFDADYTIWVHTAEESKYPDTDAMFVPPTKYNVYVDTKDAKNWASRIVVHLYDLAKNSKTKLS